MRQFASFLLPGLLASMASAAEPDREGPAHSGPALHYDFNEVRDGRLEDQSGSGRHGRVIGAKPVHSGKRKVLRFDGVDDHVEFPLPPIDPDTGLTIEMWLSGDQARFVNRKNRNPLLLGDPASLSVDRSLNLRFNQHRQFFAEYGNETTASTNFAGRAFQLNGDWQHLAVVIEAGRIHFYLDGIHHRNQALHRIPEIVPGKTWKLGGWFAGHLKCEIDDLKIYDRPLSEKELFGEVERSRPGPSLEAESIFDLESDQLDVDLWSWEPPSGEAFISLVPVGGEESSPQEPHAVRSWEASLVETHPGSGRFRAETSLDASDLAAGSYRLSVQQPVENGEVLEAAERVEIGKPAWWNSPLGRELKVMKPWTPVEVHRSETDAGTVEVAVWGRKYRFGNGGIFEQVESAGRQLLANPVKLFAEAEGISIEWQGGGAQVVEAEDAHAVIKQRFTSPAGLQADLRHRIEFDGFARTELVLQSPDTVEVNSLAFVGQWLPEASGLYSCWPPGERGSPEVLSGSLDAEVAADFKPIVFLGDPELGFAWYFESYEGWTSWSEPGAVRLVPGATEAEPTEVRFTIVDREVSVSAGRPLRIEFGWQATPVKPMEFRGSELRMFRPEGYCQELDLPDQEIEGVPALQWYADQGGGGFINWFAGDAFAYPLPLGIEARFQRLVDSSHEAGLKVFPYVVSFLISQEAPEFRSHRDFLVAKPEREYPFDIRVSNEDGNYYFASFAGPWQDLMVHRVHELIETYGVDGIYLDSTGALFRAGDSNLEAGSGWFDENGTVHPTWPVFAKRELLRRLYAVVVDSDPMRERLIDLHLWDCFNPSALAYASIGWHGEALAHGGFENMDEALPEDRILTEFTGDNIGVEIDLLAHSLIQGAPQEEKDEAFRRIMNHAAPHGIWTRPITKKQFKMMNEAMPEE